MPARLFLCCLVSLLPFSTEAQTPPVPADPATPGLILPVWPEGKMPGHGAPAPEQKNTPSAGGLLRITYVSEPTIEVFKPQGTKGPTPAMIISPGGGYGLLAYNREGTEIANWLNSLGITGIVLKYRVPNNKEGAFQDIQRAMRLVRQHAAEWNIQPDKIGVIGFSAGGHLSARLGNNFAKPAYPPIDDTDKLSCRPNWVILVYPAYLGDTGTLGPEMVISSTTPPTLIVHTEDDLHHVAGSKIYDAALTAGKVPHAFLLYPTGGHGFSLHTDKAAKVWPIDTATWLKQIGVL